MFGIAMQTPTVVLKLPLGRIEAVAQGNIDIFVIVAIHHDFISRHTDIDAHIEDLALMLVLMRHFHHDPARHDRLEEGLEFLGLVTDMRLKRIRTFDVTKGDLQWGFHLVLLSLPDFNLDHSLDSLAPAPQKPARSA
jgi:hypothetical protein